MPPLQILLAALTLIPSLSLAVAPAQVPPNGKSRGFISNLDNQYPIPMGDWLTSTLCYCYAPVHKKEKWKPQKAHIFQHEYYNYHSNSTFIVDHMCLARAPVEGDQCIRPNVGGDNNDWLMEGHFICKKFERTEEEKIRQANTKRSFGARREKRFRFPHLNPTFGCHIGCIPGAYGPDPPEESSHRHHDKVCFGVDTDFYGMDNMELTFNGQRRKMVAPGEQGRKQTDIKEVQGYCEDMCQRRFQMPANMNINDKRAGGGSRQFLYTDLDDMCDHCK